MVAIAGIAKCPHTWCFKIYIAANHYAQFCSKAGNFVYKFTENTWVMPSYNPETAKLKVIVFDKISANSPVQNSMWAVIQVDKNSPSAYCSCSHYKLLYASPKKLDCWHLTYLKENRTIMQGLQLVKCSQEWDEDISHPSSQCVLMWTFITQTANPLTGT